MSLRRRILLGIVAVAVVLVTTNVVLASTFERNLLARTDEDLLDTATRSVFDPRGPVRPPGRGGRRGGGGQAPLTDLFIAVADLDGRTLTRFGSAIDEAQQPPVVGAADLAGHVAQGRADPFTARSADGSTAWRLVAITGGGGGILVVGVSLADVEATLARLRVVQGLGTASVLVALAIAAWWVLRLGVRPVVAMAATADRIAAGDLSQRVALVDERTEVGRLGAAFNEMLGRIEEAFGQRAASEARVRRFAADASHELRTPLTSIQGYAELWQAGGLRGDGELEEAMRRMAEEGRRMGSLVEDLLLLARLDERRAERREPVRLDHVVADAARDAGAVEPDRPVSTALVEAAVLGDEAQLRQVVGNLLTNARVHTPPSTPVTIRLSTEDGVARLAVADRGPGLAPGTEAQVFERFHRADGARARARADGARPRATSGNGLGLSIVATIAAAHGGRAWAEPTPGGGATFVVELPLAAP